jgi:hypothetical protein
MKTVARCGCVLVSLFIEIPPHQNGLTPTGCDRTNMGPGGWRRKCERKLRKNNLRFT